MIDFNKQGLIWLDAYLVRNELEHIIPAMDPELYPDRTGMRYYLDLKMPEFPLSPVFETMLTLEGREKPPTSIGGAQVYEGCAFRLEEILAGQLTISAPDRGATKLSAVASLTAPFQIGEKVQPALLDRVLPPRFAIRAGLAQRDFVSYQHSFFSRYQSEKRQFLTWQPNDKMVSPGQREYLYFLLNMDPLPETINLRVRATKADGSRPVFTHSTIEGLRAFHVVCAPVGMQALGLDSDVVRYEVWLSDGNNERFTEVRAYNVDRRAHPFERFILFSNSLGGFDTLRLIGRASQETDVTRSVARKERQAGYKLDFSELEVIGVTENSGIQLSTGFFEQAADTYVDYLRELLVAESVLMDTAHGFEAINLITSNLKYQEDRPGLIERVFEFERTYSDRNYSRMLPASPLPSRPTKWVGVSSRAVLDSTGKRTGKLTWERLQKVYVDDETKVVPYAIKPNIPGDPDYLPPSTESSITPGTTPYPSADITRAIDFERQDCGSGYLGTAPVVNIPAGAFGGEMPGDGDAKAEAKFNTFNNQQYADAHGLCQVNNVPVHVAIAHKIPMDSSLKVVGTAKYGPVVDLRVGGAEMVSNTTGSNPPIVRSSVGTVTTGSRTLVIELEYASGPFQACKLKVVGKNKELTANGPGFYLFENVQINTSDDPLVVEVTAV